MERAPHAGVMGIVLAGSIAITFALSAAPPTNIFGVYGSHRDSVRVTRGNADRIRIALRLHFSNGHTCSLDQQGEWAGDHVLIVAEGIEQSQACRLQAFFSGGQITLKDDGQRCAQVFCGTRGKLDAVRLPRRRP